MDEDGEEFSFPCLRCGTELAKIKPTVEFEIICPNCGFVDHV